MEDTDRSYNLYETPAWQTKALRSRVYISGTMLECCSGDGSIVRQFPDCNVISNDIDTKHKADYRNDVLYPVPWTKFPEFDWVVTNPPFNCAINILQHAHKRARIGVALLLRLSFLEPTKKREEFLVKNPPSVMLVLPRWSYTMDGSTDSVTTAWFVWAKVPTKMEIIPLEEKLLGL